MVVRDSARKATHSRLSISDSTANSLPTSPVRRHDFTAYCRNSNSSHGGNRPSSGGSCSGPWRQSQLAETSSPKRQKRQKQYDEENVSLLSTSPDTSTSPLSLFTPSQKTTLSTTHGRVACQAVPDETCSLPLSSMPSRELHSSSGRTASIDEEVSAGRRFQEDEEEAEGQIRSSRGTNGTNRVNASHGTYENNEEAASDFHNTPIPFAPETEQHLRHMGSETATSTKEDVPPDAPFSRISANELHHSNLRRGARQQAKGARVQENQMPSKEAALVTIDATPCKKIEWKKLTKLAMVLTGFAWSAAGASQSFTTAKAVAIDFSGGEQQGKLQQDDVSSMWLTSAYLVTFGTFILPAKRVQIVIVPPFIGLTAGACWMALWSVAAGFSSYASHHGGMALLCFCRAMQGLGASLVTTNGHVILEDTDLDFGVGASVIVTTCLGALVGAVMATLLASFDLGWRWMYFCLGAWSTTLFAWGLWLTERNDYVELFRRFQIEHKLGSLWKKLDLPGAGLLVLSAVLSVTGWNQLGGAGFTTPYPYVLIVAGALFVVALVVCERDMDDPLWRIDGFQSAKMSSILSLIITTSMAFAVWAWYMTRIAEDVFHYSALKTCIGVTLATVSGVSASLATWTVGTRVSTAVLFLAGTSFLVLGLACSVGASLASHLVVLVILSVIVAPAGTVTVLCSAVHAINSYTALAGATPLVLSIMLLSFTMGLGVAGTVKRGASESGEGEIATFRDALYFGIGVASLGLVLAVLVLIRWLSRRRSVIA